MSCGPCNVEEDPELGDILPQRQDQNFSSDIKWTLENNKANFRLAFEKGRRGGERTTLVLACAPDLRTALLEKGRLYVG